MEFPPLGTPLLVGSREAGCPYPMGARMFSKFINDNAIDLLLHCEIVVINMDRPLQPPLGVA